MFVARRRFLFSKALYIFGLKSLLNQMSKIDYSETRAVFRSNRLIETALIEVESNLGT